VRKPAARVKPRLARDKTFPAPTGGWIANQSLATPGAQRADGTKVQGAAVLENCFPTATGVRMRRGSQRHAIIGDGSLPVVSLFAYANGNNRKLFGATEAAIYDITTPEYTGEFFLVDDDGNFLVDEFGNFLVLEGDPIPAEVDDLTGGAWITVQFATSGGTFLRMVNGADTPLVYDGTGFDTDPAITGLTPSTLSYVWAYKQRLFFTQKDTLDAWYLPVDTIGGEAVKLPLGGVFGRGGSLVFGATWSLDSGSGLSEQCIFVTTEGEVAVFQGTNPGDAAAWSKVGIYRIGRPLGPKAWIKAGGDIVVATDIGFVPLSQAIQRDIAALSPAAVSFPIEDEWNRAVRERGAMDWNCEVWPTKQMVVVALPQESGTQKQMFVANARTGAWGNYIGWGANCVAVFGDRFFWGADSGRVIEGEVTGREEDLTPYTMTVVPLFDSLKSPAALKTGLQARAVMRAAAPVNGKLSLQSDYRVSLPAAPDDTSTPAGSVWGTAVWGSSNWGESAELTARQDWRSVPGSGYALSVALQVTSGSTTPPNIELVQIDFTYDQGAVGS
jgi:hypothetical protein